MNQESLKTALWHEIAEPGDPFTARVCRCGGYDVYGDLLMRANYFDYLYLLFKGEKPTPTQSRTLELLAIAIANVGPRHPMNHAAMSAGVGGSTHASVLMAALAVGAGQFGGARELVLTMEFFQSVGMCLQSWRDAVRPGYARPYRDGWGDMEHFPGFEVYAPQCALPTLQTLQAVAQIDHACWSAWLLATRDEIELIVGSPLSMLGVCAATFLDIGVDAAQAEMLFLMLRLPGAAAHALEQEKLGWKAFPFFSEEFAYEGDEPRAQPEPLSGVSA